MDIRKQIYEFIEMYVDTPEPKKLCSSMQDLVEELAEAKVKNIEVMPCCTELPTKKAMNIEIHEQYLDWRKTENGLCRKAFTLGFKQCFYWFKHFKKQN